MRGLSKKRFVAFLLIFAMLLPMLEGFCLIAAAEEEEETEETVYVLAGSDFQDTTDELSAENVEAILKNISNAGYTSFDGFMFCGDYSAGWSEAENKSGLAALKAVVAEKYPSIPNQFYVQGNHDLYAKDGNYPRWTASIGHGKDYCVGSQYCAGHQADAYSVFILNEDDYNWRQTEADETKIKNKAAELKSFLDQHVVGEKPIFVLSHVPLHYSWRTDYHGDAWYAKYIVDVLNEAGQRGLNIIFMYGHNHGGGLDNYMGGSSNFIAKGDTMYIADPLSNVSPSVERTINFTYMNAGMVGYYGDTDYDNDGYHVDGALTMTVFAITGDEVVVRRFCGASDTTVDSVTKEPYCTCTGGKHALKKCAGDWYDESEEALYGYQLNTKTYASPYTINGSNIALTVPSSLSDNTFTVGSSAVVSAAAEEGYKYTWESSDPSVVTVSAMNSVTALLSSKSEGSAKITVTKSAAGSARSASGSDSTSFYVQVTAGEGVVVEDSGDKIFRRTQTFKHGKRYIITNWSTESWELDDVFSMSVPAEGYGLETYGVTTYMYPDGVPFLTSDSIADNEANIWRFESSGDGLEDEGYLISECKTYDQTKTWYLSLATDMKTVWLTDHSNKGGYLGKEGSGLTLQSAKWTWTSCILNADSPTYWLGLVRAGSSWQSIAGSAWNSDAHMSTYIYEETNNVATATLSDKVGYVSIGAASLPTMIVKTWTTGKVEYIPLTLSMLSTSDGGKVTTGTAGIYSNLTVTYNDVVICTDYTLAVGTESSGTNNEGKYYYRLVDTFSHGKEYLIVGRNTTGKAYALASKGFNADATTAAVVLELDANGIPCVRSDISVPAAAVWKYYNDDNTKNDYWLEQPTTLWNSGNARNFLSFNEYTADGEFIDNVFNTVGSIMYSGDWYKNWPVTNLAFHTGSGANYPELKGWRSIRGWYGGTYAYITFDKHDAKFVTVGDAYRKWGEEVYILEKTPISSVTYEVLGTTGKIIAGDSAKTKVGTSVEIRYPDGNVQVVPVTANMLYLNGTALTDGNLTTAVRMTGLTLIYQGQTLTTNFTLDVLSEQENDYPEFPAPGSVRVGKHLGKSDYIFNQTGVANVELTVNGAPKQTPMDVLVILDTSSSVVDNFMPTGETRLEVMRQALGDLIDTLQAPNPDGTMPDICLAVSQFNDYTYFKDINGLKDHVIFDDREIPPEFNGKISDFMNVHEMDNFDVSQIQGHGGTNYDVAFQVAYEMLEARKQQYATIGNREQIVVFMTDGICFQYNYLSFRNGAKDSKIWEKWMIGGLTEDELNYYVPSDVFKGLYVSYGSGKHWMAEAIKGKTEDDLVSGQMMYPVIWNKNRDTGEVFTSNHYQLKPGLGATIYSIGFGIDVDGEYNAKVGKQVLSNIASNPNMYYDANDKQDLRQAFSDIGRSVRKAATDAYMKDQMGKYFDLQMGEVETSVEGQSALAAPSITIKTYDLYKTSEVGSYVNGVLVTTEMVGTRKNTIPTAVLETISFSADGKTVTSSELDSANILSNGVISGKYFYYNTSKTDTKDIVVNGKSVALEPETIYWYIGDIIEQEVVLSYYVYLEDSLAENGVGREAGTYDTNNFADLHYLNFNDVRCTQSTQSPKLPWETATVGYAFYLVDENGNVITNQATGETGGFANRIPVTTVVTNELLLNVDSNKYNSTISAGLVMPEGYTLYDPNASYMVHVNSGEAGGSWEITTSQSKATTYVTGYHGNDFTTEQTSSNASYDYSHTTVWFAVKYIVQAMPDAVVIDYGLPVDIHLLTNDLFPTAAAVDGIFFGKVPYTHKPAGETGQPNVSDTAQGAFGTATLDKAKGTLRYTLNTANGMQMDREEVFTYRVPYDYTTMKEGKVAVEKRNYYSTVTIIPAANIYYEDNFFTFTNSKAMDGDIGKWISEGSIGDKTQAEDRPGTDSKFEIDADNVYGYDSVNGTFEEYSLDTYQKVTVNQTSGSRSNAPAVQFTFTGTGFDLISLTNSDSGLITVEVSGPETKNLVVDNYYGYTYSGGKWIVDQNASDCLYQVPVIKVSDLTYGTYTVTVRVAYMAMFDHKDDGSYSFWMDAVRIYNPANPNGSSYGTISGAYEKDQESNPCFETIRNVLVSAGSFHADGSTGAVFIDGKLNSGATVAEYANQGPNNEVYLAGGQTIAFKLVTNTNPANIQTVQIGAKLAKGSNAQLYHGTKELVTLTTATNMFYKLANVSWKETIQGKQWTSSTIVLTNKAASGTTDNIISLTDVKVTSKVALTLITDTAATATELLSNTEEPAIILYADSQTVEYAAAVMNAIEGESDDITGEESDSASVAVTGKSFSLSFEDEVQVNLYYAVSDMTNVTEHGMLLFYSDPGTVDIANADMVYNEPVHVEPLGNFMATTGGIAAKEMGDTRYYVAYAKLTDGSYVYSAVYDYSPKKYAMNLLGREHTADKQKALCVAMLNYGAAAQEFFGYNTDSLMNAELTAEQQALVIGFDASLFTGAVAADTSKIGNFGATSSGFSNKSATVSFDGAFCVNYYFAPSTTVNGDMILYIWTPEVYAAAETLTAENAETMTMVARYDGSYWGQVSGIAAKNLDDTYYVAGVYTDADGNTHCTGVIAYSLSRYCLNKAVNGNEMQGLASATAMYGYYAKNYFAA